MYSISYTFYTNDITKQKRVLEGLDQKNKLLGILSNTKILGIKVGCKVDTSLMNHNKQILIFKHEFEKSVIL